MSALALVACENGAIATQDGDGGIVPTSDATTIDGSVDSGDDPAADAPVVPPLDVAPSEDVNESSLCEAGTGCFEEPCDDPQDCNSAICVEHMGEKVCSKTCDEECPDGWTCSLVTAGSDGQYVCTSNFSDLCVPCATTEGCDGASGAACVTYGQGSSFCGGSCDLEHPCPTGYSCQDVETTSGATSFQCVSDSGTCECSSAAIDRGASTPCTQENEHGVCQGLRVCDPSGLLDCDAPVPAPEVCNGIDDDCDGTTDLGTCDDGNPCTTDTCSGEEGCVHEDLDGGECLDGDSCTAADHCEAGVCVGMPVDCSDDNPCTIDSCDGAGGCLHEPQTSLCDDGDPCTIGDLCDGGECAGSVSLDCDDANPCTDDSCSETGCVHAPNASECDDSNACTESSACVAGACAPTAPVDCDDGNACTTDTCDPASGCAQVANTLPCDDGDVCSLGDACGDDACQTGSGSLTCDDGNPCTTDTCDPEIGCVFAPNEDSCDDTNACTVMDTCVGGQCVGSGSLACDDGNPCTVDSCLTEDGCTHEAFEGGCDDGDPCTLGDACSDAQCVSGSPLACDDQNGCTDDTCAPEVGCVFTANEADCEDGNECTNLDMCWQGTCVAMGTIDCDDGNPCTADVCKPLEGCVHTAIDVPCSDGDPCTTADVCSEGSCTGGPLLSCDDGNPCTTESCTGGACVFDSQDGPCDDGDACTLGDHCEAGVCVLDAELGCDDEDVCTDDGCSPSDGCTHTFNASPCDDESVCTSNSTCESGSCVGEDDADCDDGNPCTTDSCDPEDGCVHEDNTLPCDDENLCTTSSQCDQGDCLGVVDVVCDDGDACTADECVPQSGCVTTPQACCGNGVTDPGEQCDDGNETDDDSCNNSCVSNGPPFHMNGVFYVSDNLWKGDFNAGGGFCTAMVGQTAYIAGNNASLPNPESANGTWQGNGTSPHSQHNCMGYSVITGEGYGTQANYGSCSQFRNVVCTTDPQYCNGYGLEYCHYWD